MKKHVRSDVIEFVTKAAIKSNHCMINFMDRPAGIAKQQNKLYNDFLISLFERANSCAVYVDQQQYKFVSDKYPDIKIKRNIIEIPLERSILRRLKKFLLSDQSERLRGSCYFEFDSNTFPDTEIYQRCRGVTFLSNAPSTLGRSFYRRVQQRVRKQDDLVYLVFHGGGMGTALIFAGDRKIESLVKNAYGNSVFSEGFLTLYGADV